MSDTNTQTLFENEIPEQKEVETDKTEPKIEGKNTENKNIKVEPTQNIDKKYTYNPQNEEYFEWKGQKFDIKTLPPEAIKEFYKTHANIANWRKKLTQSQQEVAEQRRMLESVQNQIAAINSFFDEHPDLFNIIKAYKEAIDNGEDAKAYLLKKVFNQEMQKQAEQGNINTNVRMPFETQKEYEERIRAIEEKLRQKEQEELEERAKKALKQKFPDLSDEEFEEYANKLANKNISLEDLFEIIEKARRYEKYLQEQKSNDATLLGNNYKPNNVTPNKQESSIEENPDTIFDSIWKKVFK